jgi:hypothetical protein
MTTAEQYAQKVGQRRFAEGRLQTLREVVLKLLLVRFGPLSEEKSQRVELATEVELSRFLERVANPSVATIEDVLS